MSTSSHVHPRINRALCGLLIAAVLLGACGSDDGKRSGLGSSSASTASTATTATATTASTVTTTAPAPESTPDGRVFSVRITASAPSEKSFKVTQGERVTLRVTSSRADELHVHGYDKTLDLKAGKTVELRFTANLVGAWEIELEQAHQPVGSLVVEPA